MHKLSKYGRRLCGALCVFVVLGSVNTLSAATTEQTLTVAFLYNFLKFTDWPKTAISGNTVKICITDSTPFRNEFDAIAGRSAQNKTVEIKPIELGESLNECQLLFLPMEEKPVRLREWLKNADNLPILTVGNQESFLEMGGMIMLVWDASHMQFEVSLDPIKRAGLALNAQLLGIARNVK
jgi:YfiR/HmsC-like